MLSSIATISGLVFLTDAAAAQLHHVSFSFKDKFSGDSAVGDGIKFGVKAGVGSVNGAIADIFPHHDDDPKILDISRQKLLPIGTLPRACDCLPSYKVRTDDIRDISNKWAADGNDINRFGITNMIWGFGQFLDHDLALTIEDEDGPTDEVGTADPDNPMELHRAVTTYRGRCKSTLNVHTGHVDAGPVYGTDEKYVQGTLREPGTCLLRTSISEGEEFLPITTKADKKGRFLFIAGDVRVSEHAFLAAQHTVWLREHNRVCREVDADKYYNWLSPDAKFDIVRNVVIAKFQQVVLKEFLPALGITKKDLRKLNRKRRSMHRPDVSMEFSIAYRLGHDLIGNKVGGFSIMDAFDAESFFLDLSGSKIAPSVTIKHNAAENVNDIFSALSSTPCAEFDGKLADSLRNHLFGEGQDLVARNIYRGRELGILNYDGLAKCFGIEPHDKVAVDTPDAWLGLMHEPKYGATPLGATTRAILIDQFHRSFYGPGGLHWKRDRLTIGKFEKEIKNTKYSKIIRANTGANVRGNVFKMKTKQTKA